ncbi:Zn-dependent exopeptidase [Rickenella mellea]|uniref:Peptide hydrolase n=1 Tax=Rickenella mellea TaxID=50990 RepID=A0A4Y7Q9K1_9AGAM|nr:Zn-dependent exopeptidase [Rickenella mellea]
MKSVAALLALASLAIAGPQFRLNNDMGGDLYDASAFQFDLAELRLIQLGPDQEPVWMTEREKILAKADGVNFLDVTDTPDLGSFSHIHAARKSPFHAPSNKDAVKSVLKNLSTEGMEENLATFTSFRTRHYRSDTGKQSQKWLLSRISEITKKSASKSLQGQISISEFAHSWGQNSIVVHINGTSSDDDGIVIIGAHQDSTNLWPFLPAPGADDDGSGSVTILEAYRGLISADFRPQKSVEFHWYSAEEGGLLGSQALAKSYEARGANVIAMSQFDMTAWVKRGTKETVGIITDFVDADLTEFNKKLVDAYLGIPYVETKCGYACSDHASWAKAGYASSFTIESKFEDSNPHIHSQNDRIGVSDEFSFTHMLEFAKLASAFAIELGGWDKKA